MQTIKYGFRGREVVLKDVQDAVGAGWALLIENLVNDLFQLGWDGVVLQVKEKFGGLRFYVGDGNHTQSIQQRISQAESASYKICEICGMPGTLRRGGWLKVLCDEHANGREPEIDE